MKSNIRKGDSETSPNTINDNHLLFIVTVIIILGGLWIPYIRPYFPSRDEPFFEFAILGENGKADDYFPNNVPEVYFGEQINWKIYIGNHMGKDEYVSIRLKLLNSTNSAPNSNKCTPSSGPVIHEFTEILDNNETIIIPLSWSINSNENDVEYPNIDSITVNDDLKEVNLSDNNSSYRVVIELWVYDSNLNTFQFGWETSDGERCAWNQIWFKTV